MKADRGVSQVMTDFTIDTDILSSSQTLSPKYNLYSSLIPGNTISSGIALEITGASLSGNTGIAGNQ